MAVFTLQFDSSLSTSSSEQVMLDSRGPEGGSRTGESVTSFGEKHDANASFSMFALSTKVEAVLFWNFRLGGGEVCGRLTRIPLERLVYLQG